VPLPTERGETRDLHFEILTTDRSAIFGVNNYTRYVAPSRPGSGTRPQHQTSWGLTTMATMRGNGAYRVIRAGKVVHVDSVDGKYKEWFPEAYGAVLSNEK